MSNSIPIIIFIVVSILIIFKGLKVVDQGFIGVTTIFGKFHKIISPGLNFIIPFFEKVDKRISIQNKSIELEFNAITLDQANVFFSTMILYSVVNGDEETIKNVAYKFFSEKDLETALIRSVEGTTRGFVATKKQAEILGLRGEIVDEVKSLLDQTLASWGYHLIDVQLNDIKFDERVTQSMAEVVASMNLKAAATNQGDALLIKRTKEAQAEGAAITIAANAERDAAKLRGEGVALFREEVSKGLADAAELLRSKDVDQSFILFSIWTESLRHIAEKGKGNVIFFDGSTSGMERQLKEILAFGNLSQFENKIKDNE